MFYIEFLVFLVRCHVDVYFFELFNINMNKHHHTDHPNNTFAVGLGKAICGSNFGEKKKKKRFQHLVGI